MSAGNTPMPGGSPAQGGAAGGAAGGQKTGMTGMCNLDNAAVNLNALRDAAKKEMTDILAVRRFIGCSYFYLCSLTHF
jgi:hypothetical protein